MITDETSVKQFFQLVIVGVEGSGKTTFMQRLKLANKGLQKPAMNTTDPTMGMDVSVDDIAGVKSFIYDLGGQQQFEQAYWNPLLKKADAVIYIINAARPSSFGRVKKHLNFIFHLLNRKKIPLLILANKQDLEGALSIEQICDDINMNQLTLSYPEVIHAFFPTSTKNGYNISESLNWLVDALLDIHDIIAITKIYEIYIYDRRSGLPLSYLFPINEKERGSSESRAMLISGFNAALGSFSEEMFSNTSTNILLIKDPNNPERNLKIINYKNETTPLNCIIVADATADDENLEILVRDITTRFMTEIEWQQMTSSGIINPRDIRSIATSGVMNENLKEIIEITPNPLQLFLTHETKSKDSKTETAVSNANNQSKKAKERLDGMESVGNIPDVANLTSDKLPDVSELETIVQDAQENDELNHSSQLTREIMTKIDLKEDKKEEQHHKSVTQAQAENEFFEVFQKLSVLERVKVIEQGRRKTKKNDHAILH